MGNSSRIPAVFIGRNDGEALRNYLTLNPTAVGRIQLTPSRMPLNVTNTLFCTHVGVQLQTTHPRRSDVRVTLVSPMGTRSVLQSINSNAAPGPVDWTHWSTQHFFYESSAGTWQVEVSDERGTTYEDSDGAVRPATGAVTRVWLIVEASRSRTSITMASTTTGSASSGACPRDRGVIRTGMATRMPGNKSSEPSRPCPTSPSAGKIGSGNLATGGSPGRRRMVPTTCSDPEPPSPLD